MLSKFNVVYEPKHSLATFKKKILSSSGETFLGHERLQHLLANMLPLTYCRLYYSQINNIKLLTFFSAPFILFTFPMLSLSLMVYGTLTTHIRSLFSLSSMCGCLSLFTARRQAFLKERLQSDKKGELRNHASEHR